MNKQNWHHFECERIERWREGEAYKVRGGARNMRRLGVENNIQFYSNIRPISNYYKISDFPSEGQNKMRTETVYPSKRILNINKPTKWCNRRRPHTDCMLFIDFIRCTIAPDVLSTIMERTFALRYLLFCWSRDFYFALRDSSGNLFGCIFSWAPFSFESVCVFLIVACECSFPLRSFASPFQKAFDCSAFSNLYTCGACFYISLPDCASYFHRSLQLPSVASCILPVRAPTVGFRCSNFHIQVDPNKSNTPDTSHFFRIKRTKQYFSKKKEKKITIKKITCQMKITVSTGENVKWYHFDYLYIYMIHTENRIFGWNYETTCFDLLWNSFPAIYAPEFDFQVFYHFYSPILVLSFFIRPSNKYVFVIVLDLDSSLLELCHRIELA